jgi:hypothetical protein
VDKEENGARCKNGIVYRGESFLKLDRINVKNWKSGQKPAR